MEYEELNVSRMFILPLLGIPKETLMKNGLVTTFLWNKQSLFKEGYLHLLFKPFDNIFFSIFLDEYRNRIVEETDYEGGYIMIVFEIPKEFKEDIELIKEGKYSEVSDKMKRAIPKKTSLFKNGLFRDQQSIQHLIMNKSKEVKEFVENKYDIELEDGQEVWSMMNNKKETFDYDEQFSMELGAP